MVTSTTASTPTAGNIAYAAAKSAAEAWMAGVAHFLRDSQAASVVVAVKALLTDQMVGRRAGQGVARLHPRPDAGIGHRGRVHDVTGERVAAGSHRWGILRLMTSTPWRGFASDNYAGIHPEVLAAIARANAGPSGRLRRRRHHR